MMIATASLQHLTSVALDMAGRRALLLTELAAAGCVVGVVAYVIHRATSRSSFATRATALHVCTVLLLVFSVVQLLPRGMTVRSQGSKVSSSEPAWTRGPRIATPRVVERALTAPTHHDGVRVAAGALVLIWIGGVTFMMVRLLRGALQLAGVRLRAREHHIATGRVAELCFPERRVPAPVVLVSDEIDIPYVCGWWRPAIVVPAASEAWTTHDWQMVLHHESSHVARGDVLVQWIRQVTLALHWFNPAVRWLIRTTDEACEGACDDAVLLRGADAARYTCALLSFADGRWSYSAAPTPTIVGRSGLERRVLAMIDVRRRRRRPASADRLIPIVAGLAGGLILAVIWPRPALAVVDAATQFQSPNGLAQAPQPAAARAHRTPLLRATRSSSRPSAPPGETAGQLSVQTSSDTTDALLGLGDALSDVNPIVRDAAANALVAWRSDASLARLRRVADRAGDSRRDAARAAISVMENSR
jgi:beta-lactamase regulating signal transducer with metallopeptidase domain